MKISRDLVLRWDSKYGLSIAELYALASRSGCEQSVRDFEKNEMIFIPLLRTISHAVAGSKFRG